MAKITKTSPFADFCKCEPLDIEGVELFVGNIGLYTHKDDLLFVKFAKNTQVAGIFTLSKMASDPVLWDRECLKGGIASGLVVNSGCSNTFTGEHGRKIIHEATLKAAEIMGANQSEIFVASTGVIGVKFDEKLIPNALETLTKADFTQATKAIETTDTFSKMYSVRTHIEGKEVKITGIIKGSGMVEPNMATMLGFIFTNASIPSDILQAFLDEFKDETFNAITVDSDSSTSDTVLLFASGAVQNSIPKSADDAILSDFKKTLFELMLNLAKQVVMDGEGASKFITVSVEKAASKAQAHKIGKSIANSPLVKTAIAGADANWGRIAMAVGKTLEAIRREDVEIYFGDMLVAKNWQAHADYDKTRLSDYLKNRFIEIKVVLNNGTFEAKTYTCDLTHEYIKINADYTS
jgi:glutamate N-acetyltransferase/amino-acid N-acetyltransferase